MSLWKLRASPRVAIASALTASGSVLASGGVEFLGSGIQCQKENDGVSAFSASAATSAAGGTLISFVAIRTSLFAGPLLANNGNSYTQNFSQEYGNGFTAYTLRGFHDYSASGGSNHEASGTKSSGSTEEVTTAIVVLSGGSIVSQQVVQVAANGAGATLTSGTVTTTGAAMLVAVASGDGDINATAPTQTWPAEWTVRQSVAFNSTDAPVGHIPLYVATRPVSSSGSYSVGVQMTINEGATIALYAVQV